MIITVFSPYGIVAATTNFDSFYEQIESEEGTMLLPIKMEGLPHTYTFWNKFSITFNVLNSYSLEDNLLDRFEDLLNKWESIPLITDFMPYLKKLLVDSKIQIIGIVAAYDMDKDKSIVPFVYQILGTNIRRINIDSNGHINYNCVFLERTPIVGKLLRQTQIKNGDVWDNYPAVNLRCDLYSIQKSIDLCRFMLRTNYYVENINSALYDKPLSADLSIITKEKVETKSINI